jgi:hypothetical protein
MVTSKYGLACINVALMISDARETLVQLGERQQPRALQAGVLLGLTAAGHVLDGMTADEAWDEIKPLLTRLRHEETTTESTHEQ